MRHAAHNRTIVGANCSEGGKEEKEEDPMTDGERMGERERERSIRSFVNLRLLERERDIYIVRHFAEAARKAA